MAVILKKMAIRSDFLTKMKKKEKNGYKKNKCCIF